MSNSTVVIPFQFNEHQIRTVARDGEPWFVARDVCDVLELDNITWALEGLDDDELTLEKLKSGGQRREMKYTLDLTKIVTKPTPQSLEMLERLTGISFADIDLPEFAVEVGTPWIHWFVNSCCQRAENSKTSATELYRAFVCWYRENIDKVEAATPSQRLFGAEMKKVDGVVRFRESAGVYYRGVQLQKGMEVTA